MGCQGGSPPLQGSCPTAIPRQRSLSLQVDKLRLLLLEKEDANLLLSDKYLEQVREPWGAALALVLFSSWAGPWPVFGRVPDAISCHRSEGWS